MNIRNSTIPNSPKVEQPKCSINRWMDKQKKSPYNGLLSSYKKEWGTGSCYNTGEPWKHHTMWRKPVTKVTYFVIQLYEWNVSIKEMIF